MIFFLTIFFLMIGREVGKHRSEACGKTLTVLRNYARVTARQLRQFAQECAGAMGDDERAAAGPIVPGDLDFAGEDDAQPMADIADAGEGFAGAN